MNPLASSINNLSNEPLLEMEMEQLILKFARCNTEYSKINGPGAQNALKKQMDKEQ